MRALCRTRARLRIPSLACKAQLLKCVSVETYAELIHHALCISHYSCMHALFVCAREQGGSHVEVLSAQGRDPMAHCKLTGNVSRRWAEYSPLLPSPQALHVILCDLGPCCRATRYDKSIRGYVQVMEGDSTSTRMQLPGNERTSCEWRLSMRC